MYACIISDILERWAQNACAMEQIDECSCELPICSLACCMSCMQGYTDLQPMLCSTVRCQLSCKPALLLMQSLLG